MSYISKTRIMWVLGYAGTMQLHAPVIVKPTFKVSLGSTGFEHYMEET
jgi:hypothetical protein